MPTTTAEHALITGVSTGFGALIAKALLDAGHTVVASMRRVRTEASAALVAHAAGASGTLHIVELDVTDQRSVDAAVHEVIDTIGYVDVVVHNAGHLFEGAAEAFLPEQFAVAFDINVIGAQRLNRSILPHLRDVDQALMIWIGSTSTRGGCPPFYGPYFAAKAAMDALAVSYAAELILFGIETCIVVPGVFPTGTHHFTNATAPADHTRAAIYADRYGPLIADLPRRLGHLVPSDARPESVATAVADLIATKPGHRPFRVHVDPSRDGSEVVSAVADRMRADFFRRAQLDELLTDGASR